MGAATLPSSRCPTFIRDMFDESLDLILRKSWPDCLDEEFGVNNIMSTELVARWKAMTPRERGLWMIGKLWNDTSTLSSSNCDVLDVPLGSSYASAVRKSKLDLQKRLLPKG